MTSDGRSSPPMVIESGVDDPIHVWNLGSSLIRSHLIAAAHPTPGELASDLPPLTGESEASSQQSVDHPRSTSPSVRPLGSWCLAMRSVAVWGSSSTTSHQRGTL